MIDALVSLKLQDRMRRIEREPSVLDIAELARVLRIVLEALPTTSDDDE